MTMRGDGVDADLVRAAEIGKTLLERNAWLERELERAKERIEEREVRYQALSQECWTHEKTTRKLKSQLRRYMSAEGSTTTLTEETTQPLLRRLKVVMNERAVLQKSVVELTGRCEELEGQVRETKSVVMGYGEKMRRLRDEVKGLEKEKREWSSMPALRWRSGDMGGRMVVSSAPDLRGVKESQGMETVGASMVLLRQEESQRDDADESLMEQVQQLERERDELCRIIEDLQETVSRQEEELLVSRDAVDDGVETLDMIEKVGRNVEKGMQTDPEMEMRWIEGMRERDEIDEMLSGMSTPISISLNSEDWDDVMNSRNLIDDEQGVINNELPIPPKHTEVPIIEIPLPAPGSSPRWTDAKLIESWMKLEHERGHDVNNGAGMMSRIARGGWLIHVTAQEGRRLRFIKLYPAALTMSWSEVGGRGWRDEEIKTIFVKNIKEEKDDRDVFLTVDSQDGRHVFQAQSNADHDMWFKGISYAITLFQSNSNRVPDSQRYTAKDRKSLDCKRGELGYSRSVDALIKDEGVLGWRSSGSRMDCDEELEVDEADEEQAGERRLNLKPRSPNMMLNKNKKKENSLSMMMMMMMSPVGARRRHQSQRPHYHHPSTL